MTNVKFNSIPFERTFTSLVDDFFYRNSRSIEN